MESPNLTIDFMTQRAITYNFLRIMRNMEYGTVTDFISDAMNECLQKGIISQKASENEVWYKYNIPILEQEPVEMKRPFASLPYIDESEPYKAKAKEYWPFKLKRVELPNGWRLEKGCECGGNISPSTFRIYDDKNTIIVNLEYFPKFNSYDEKPPMEKIMDRIDDNLEKLSKQV